MIIEALLILFVSITNNRADILELMFSSLKKTLMYMYDHSLIRIEMMHPLNGTGGALNIAKMHLFVG